MKTKKNILLNIFIVLCMLVGLVAPVFADASDIKGNLYEKQIEEFYTKGIIKGYRDGTFRPDNNITRAEFIIVVNRAFGLTEKVKINFSDISASLWFADDIAKAQAVGYITGYKDGTLKPDKEISRLEVAKAVSLLLGLDTSGDKDIKQFKDLGEVLQQDKGFLNAAVAEKFIQGYPDETIRPLNLVTRGEAVSILYSALEYKSRQLSAKEVELTGWLEDAHCAEKISDPAKGTKMCLLMKKCEASGYGIVVLQKDGSYKFYKFDEDGHKLAKVKILDKTKKEADLKITVKGILNGNTIKVSAIAEN